MKTKRHWHPDLQILRCRRGFTLVELMIAMLVSMVLVGAVLATHQVQTTAYTVQREVSKMQQGLRGSLHVLTWDLRNGLRDPSPKQENRFIQSDVTGGTRWYDVTGAINNAGQPAIAFQSLRLDNDNDGVAEQQQRIYYMIRDDDLDGLPGLYRQAIPADIGGQAGWQLVADGIQAIGFAFAVDRNGDNVLDRFNGDPLRSILWCVDSDNDGDLDAILDTNDDGRIDETDNGGVAGFIPPSGQLATPATYDDARAVRIFVLTISDRPFNDKTIDQKFYVVGNQVIQAPQDRFKRRLMTIDVSLRNYIR